MRLLTIKEQLARDAARHAARRQKPVAPKPLDLTPEGIDAMDKAAIIELMEAHGMTADKRKGRDTLADELKAVVFI